MKRTCKQCGREFELSESEISFYKSKGLELPKRCKSCREKNKGYSSNQTGQQQKSARPSSSTGGASWNDNNNNNRNRNDKSYVVVAAVAILFIFLVVFIKNKLTLPSENNLLSEQTVLSNTQSVQSVPETIKETSVAAQGDTSEETQQTKSTDDKEPIKKQPTQEPEKKEEEQPQTQPQPDTDAPQNETVPATVIETVLDAVPATQTVTYQFRKPQYLTEHFQKHGAEFPYTTEEEYLLGANNVIQNPDALHKYEAEDGDDVYYVESTREFVIVSTDGYIRTYYLADIDYYNRQ